MLNFCANNYLGLAEPPAAASRPRRPRSTRYGYGMASVRFICGTQERAQGARGADRALPRDEDTILYSSCFDANGGLFETLLGAEDAIISDALNHASIIDGVRLCKAQPPALRQQRHGRAATRSLKETQDARFRLIATDGVFSMDG